MSWLSTFFSGGDTVRAIGDTVDKLFTSDDERLERANQKAKDERDYNLELAKLDAQAMQNQADINKIEAASSSLFVAGWRPAIGWICGIAFAYAYIIEPIARFVAQVLFGYAGQFPVVDLGELYPVLMGMLGLGVMRSFEKHKGVATK